MKRWRILSRLLPVPKVWVPAYGLLVADTGIVIRTGKFGREEVAVLVMAILWAAAGYAAPGKS